MNEDIQFLKDLQNELKTQEIDGQAAPRFWSIMDYRIVPTHEEYGMERMSYYNNDGDHSEFKTVDELREYLTDYYLGDDEYGGLKEILERDDVDFETLWSFVKEYLNDGGYFNEVPVKEESFIAPDTMFLTKEEAKRHLKLNHYHYSAKAHTYAMTAWRAPKVERLITILETFDWDMFNKQFGEKSIEFETYRKIVRGEIEEI